MKIAIYQVNIERDYDRVAFQGLDELKQFQGSSEIESEIYDKVFDGEVNCKNLEDVYRMFNLDHPKGYKGRSLSVSDIVEVIDTDNKSTYNYCDSIGFQSINFNPSLTKEFKEEKIKVILCKPGKFAKVVNIENTLESLQDIVKGNIETYYPFNDDVCIICNEEGKFNGMEPSRAIYNFKKDGSRELLGVVFGTFIICDCSRSSFGSLSNNLCEKYKNLFLYPEKLININGNIVSIPFNPYN